MFEIPLRPRYADTDQMGFVHHSNYVKFYEYARWEAIRKLGLPYKIIEKKGILMPVIEMSLQFIKPAYYDDELSITVQIEKIGSTRLKFSYKTIRLPDQLINKAVTILTFIKKENGKPCRIPEFIDEMLMQNV